MAGTGGTTSYSPISLLTGTTLLPPKPTAPKPTVVVSQPTQGGGLTTTAPKAVVISQPTQGGGSSGSASTTPKKTTTPTLSEMMGSSGAASSSSAKKPATNTLSQMMGSSGTAKAATTTKAPTADQKKAINSLAGLDAAAAKMPGQSKAAIANQFMQALSAAAKEGKAVPNPAGLTAEEADKYRSQFYTQFYNGQPVQQIVDNTAIPTTKNFNAMFPAIRPSGPQAPLPDLSSPLYQANTYTGTGVTPYLVDFGNGELGVGEGTNIPYMGEAFGTPEPSPFGFYPQRFDVGAPDTRALGAAMSPRQIAQPVYPYGRGIDAIGMPQIDYGNPAAVPYGRGVIPGPMPQMDYVAPGNQQITFTPQAVRPGVPSGMPAAPFIPQAVRPGQPSGMPAARLPAAPAGGGYTTDMLNSKGIARYLLQDMMGQQRPSAPAIVAQQQGGETGGVYDLTKIPPTPAPRPVNIAEVTIPLDEMMRRTREEAGLGAGKVPTDPAEFAALVNAGLKGLGSYDPASGRMTIIDPNGPAAQAAKQKLLNPERFDFAGETARDVFAPYIAAATERRIPYPAADVPPDLTSPGNISAQGIGAERGISAALPSAASSVSPQGIGAERGIATSTPYAAQQKAAVDAILAGGQAAAAIPTPANRQGQYGALDDLLSGRLFEQWTAEGEAQRAKRLAEGVDPNNLYDNMLWSAGLYRPKPGAPSAAPAPSPASTVLPPDNSLRQPQAVTQDVLAGLGVRPTDPFVQQYGNVPAILGAKNPDGSQRVFAGGRTEEPLGTLSASGAFTSGRAPVKTATVAEEQASTPEAVSSSPEGDGSYMPPSEEAAPVGFETQVTAAAGANRTPTGAKRFTPAEGQIVGTNGYIYEVSGTDAQGKPTYKNVGKVPGYTDAQLYKAANRGAFRDPSNIPQGGTTPKPPSALRTWARAQLDKFNAENAKKKAEAEAKGETYNPITFMDYLQLAGSAATGNVAGLLMKGGQMVYPQILEWLASGPAYPTSRDDGTMMDGSPSSSSKKKSKKDDKKDEEDGTDTGTGGSGGSGGSGYTPTGGSLAKGYTMSDFPYLMPYLQAVFPPSTYRPGVDPEWNYYPGSERAYAQGGAVSAPRLVLGPGGPREDKIPAKIDGVHEAKLSNGEFVITAAAVKGIGGGDMKRGAAELMKLNDMFSHRPDSGRLNVEKIR